MVLSFSPSTPKLVNFPNFLTCTSLRKTCQHQKFEKKHVNTKTSNFVSHFLTCTSLRKTCQHQKFEKKHVNSKTSPFSPFFDLHEFEKNMSTPKLVNFPHFLDSRSLRQKHVNTKTSQFSPFFDLHEFEKNMSTPKLVNFHNFLDSRSLRKTCQHQN